MGDLVRVSSFVVLVESVWDLINQNKKKIGIFFSDLHNAMCRIPGGETWDRFSFGRWDFLSKEF